MKYKREIAQYLRSYPEVLKWINECPACHHRGYRSDMPEQIGRELSIMAKNIRKYFDSMEVDETGFCMICSKLQKR